MKAQIRFEATSEEFDALRQIVEAGASELGQAHQARATTALRVIHQAYTVVENIPAENIPAESERRKSWGLFTFMHASKEAVDHLRAIYSTLGVSMPSGVRDLCDQVDRADIEDLTTASELEAFRAQEKIESISYHIVQFLSSVREETASMQRRLSAVVTLEEDDE